MVDASRTRGTVSITGATYLRLRAWSEASGNSMSELVETLLAETMDGGRDAIPDSVIANGRPACRALGTAEQIASRHAQHGPASLTASHAELDAIALARTARLMGMPEPSPAPHRALSSQVRLGWLSEVLLDAIEDQVERSRAAGMKTLPGDHLDAALVRMIDHLESRPWCRKCLESEHCQCRVMAVRR